MGLRPPTVRRSRTAPVGVSAHAVAERAVRPIPERVGPRRSFDRLVHTETRAPVNAATPAAGSPIGDAVSQAYQVFDRYLKEGKEYAAGQSAWYSAPSMAPAVPLPGSGSSANGGSVPAADLVSAAMWLIDQMRGMSPAAATALASMSNGRSGTPAAPGANWPRPRWPPQSEHAPVSPSAHGRWVEERFDDDEDDAVGKGPPPNPPPPVSGRAGRPSNDDDGDLPARNTIINPFI